MISRLETFSRKTHRTQSTSWRSALTLQATAQCQHRPAQHHREARIVPAISLFLQSPGVRGYGASRGALRPNPSMFATAGRNGFFLLRKGNSGVSCFHLHKPYSRFRTFLNDTSLFVSLCHLGLVVQRGEQEASVRKKPEIIATSLTRSVWKRDQP